MVVFVIKCTNTWPGILCSNTNVAIAIRIMRRIKDHKKGAKVKVRCLAIHPRSTKVLVLNSTGNYTTGIIEYNRCEISNN
jgi:hypothetical protein